MILFYAVSWVTSKGVQVNLYRASAFYVLGYFWWVSITYLVCYMVRYHIVMEDNYFLPYLNFILDQGYLGLFALNKTEDLVLDYLFAVTVSVGPKLIKSYTEQSLEKARVERDFLKMELTFLKSQISPHFLFNALNSIYWRASKTDEETAVAIFRLAEMMKYINYQTKDDEIALTKEVKFIEDYVFFYSMRYRDEVPIELLLECENEPYFIVPLLLIPIVENAFKHGPERSRKDAWVNIQLKVSDKTLRLYVANGVNWSVNQRGMGGIGMVNVKKQLNLHYPTTHSLTVEQTETAYHVVLEINL